MIRSTFYGFSTALSGLKASQTSMDVIGQNVSNANTDGYTRQRVNQNSVVSSTTAERYGSATGPLTGQGASINTLCQIRDTTLDSRFRTENPSVGRYDAELSAMSDIEAIFDEALTSGMRDSILALQTAFQNLSLNTGNDEFDSLTRAAASSMAKLMNQYAQQIEDAYNQEYYDFENGSVADCNSLLKELAIIDTSILKAEVAGDNPLELYDQRNTMLDQLSSYADISYNYEKQTLAPNIITNVLHVYMKTDSGQKLELINGTEFAQFGVEYCEGEDASSIGDNLVALKLSGLTDVTTDTYDDIVRKMAAASVPKEPADVTPVYGNQASYDTAGNVVGYTKKSNKNAVTNGILFGTLNMLNAAGDYEVGGSTVRGYKYYAKALDTLASTMADQMNLQNRSTRYTSDGRQLYNISYYNQTTGEQKPVMYDGKEVAAVLDDDHNVVYGFIEQDGDSRNYTFTEATPDEIGKIQDQMDLYSGKMYLLGSDPENQPDASVILNAVNKQNGKNITTSDGTTVYARYQTAADGTILTDNDGNPLVEYGTVQPTLSDFEYEFTSLSGEELKYIEAAAGSRRYTVDGKEILAAVGKDSGQQATCNGISPVYAINTGTEDNPEYCFGTIDSIGSAPFYNFTALPQSVQQRYGEKTDVTPEFTDNIAVSDESGQYRFNSEPEDLAGLTEADLNPYWNENLFTDSDGVSTKGITAKYLSVSDKWLQGTVKVTNTTSFSSNGDDNSGDNFNILKFIQLFDNPTTFSTGTGTPGQENITLFTGGYEEFLSSIGDQVALDVSTGQTTYESYKNVLTSIDNDRLSVSGVNIDEEAVDIFQYQRAYEAASRVMTALDELLDKLINGTGRAGL
ncbi:MAG: flagellar basal body rod C-terminal domain-containing protein [Anaerovoracaceae bacterium]